MLTMFFDGDNLLVQRKNISLVWHFSSMVYFLTVAAAFFEHCNNSIYLIVMPSLSFEQQKYVKLCHLYIL